MAQQGWWPWGDESRPAPRQPNYPTRQPPPVSQPYSQPYDGARAPICLQLEQRLAQEANRGSNARDILPQIDQEIRENQLAIRRGEAGLERANCYEADFLIFGRQLRRTRRCVDMDGQVRRAERRLGELQAERQNLTQSRGRSYRDDIVRELAANNCGPAYTQEARRSPNSFSNFWQDGESAGPSGNTFQGLPFATYRTICVRTCDGYFFPISFSTLPTHFDRDADVCQSKCAAPVQLYFHQNPGGGIEQALSHPEKRNYSDLKTAYRYRKEFVKGCSCKATEYLPESAAGNAAPPTGQRATLTPPAPQPAQR